MKIILFDIDRVLQDTDKLTSKRMVRLSGALGESVESVKAAHRGYVAKLPSSTDFDPEGLARSLGETFGQDAKKITDLYYKDGQIYKETLFSDVAPALKRLEKRNRLGIFSEGVKKFQVSKLTLAGIFRFFEKDLVFIFPRKLEVLASLPESTIVDDKKEVVVALSENEKFKPVWLNKKTKERAPSGILTIKSLSELS